MDFLFFMMSSLRAFIAGYDPQTLLVTGGLLLILFFAATVLLFVWNFRMSRRLRVFFEGSDAKDLEETLAECVKRIRAIDAKVEDADQFARETRVIADQAIQKYSVIRYNPFQDTGSNQSFSAAFLDSANNGVVLTSLYSREGARLYAKPIVKGESVYQLTSEEEEAIVQATGVKKRTRKRKQ